ncbi:MAG: ABC transporter permease [Lautropia sp.]
MRATPGGRLDRVALGWLVVGALAYLLLPWYALQDGETAGGIVDGLAQLWSSGLLAGGGLANGLTQSLTQQRPWLLVGLAGLAVAAVGVWRDARGGGPRDAAAARGPHPRAGALVVAGGLFAAAGLLASGLAIGARGWSGAWLASLFGEIESNQFGIGWGGALAMLSACMVFACGLATRGRFRGDRFTACAVVFCSAMLAIFIAWPVLKALTGALLDEDGGWSLATFAARMTSERVWGLDCLGGAVRCGVAWNTLALALLTATGTTVLGTAIALMAERGNRRHRRLLQVLAMLPIITPPFVVGLGLILLFGRAGVVNAALESMFGITPTRWFYGPGGVWLAQMFAFTPIAFMIMRGVVQAIAPSLEEASLMLRASPTQTFFRVTLPLLRPGLANAFLVGFIESIADFGNPIVVGGQFSVLSTEIFFAIVGAQYDQGRAASLSLVLLAFALVVFALQRRVLGRRDFTTVGGKGDAGVPLSLPVPIRRAVNGIAWPWLAFTATIYLFALSGGFVRNWGRDYTFTLAHFQTAFAIEAGRFGLVWAGTAWNSFFTTIELAAVSAPLTAALGLLIAWLLARTRFAGQPAFEFAALLAFAIPGTVLGVSYILAFNVPPFELTGTGLIIVLCFMFRNLPVGVRAGTAALRQIDASLDEASSMLGASTAQTLRLVTVPLLRAALVAALTYSFVRAITTVSAVIFLVTAENELATTYIIGRVGNGDYGIALAYCTVLMALMAIVTGLIQWTVGESRLGRRTATAGAGAVAAPTPPRPGASDA